MFIVFFTQALGAPWSSCDAGDAPSAYVKASCVSYYVVWDGDEPVEVPYDVCDTHAGGDGHCEPAFNWDGEAVEVRAATYYNGSSKEFSVWGTAASGEPYCCTWDEGDDGELYVDGAQSPPESGAQRGDHHRAR